MPRAATRMLLILSAMPTTIGMPLILSACRAAIGVLPLGLPKDFATDALENHCQGLLHLWSSKLLSLS